LKANVLGIDATRATLEIAKAHAQQDPQLDANLKYIHTTAGIFFKREFCIIKIFHRDCG